MSFRFAIGRENFWNFVKVSGVWRKTSANISYYILGDS